MYIRRRITIKELLTVTWRIHLVLLPLATIVTVLYIEWLHRYVKLSPTVVMILGTALAFFIGFTNAQAYDRWWEARKIWGSLINDSRSWGRMVMSFFCPKSTDKEEEDRIWDIQKGLIYRHLAFTCATRAKLRGESQKEYLKYLTDDEIQRVEERSDVPTAILMLQGKAIDTAERNRDLDVIRMAQMNETLNQFSYSLGGSERIKSTVFPGSYAHLTRVSLWIFMVVLPMTLSDVTGYWAILYSYILGFIFVGTFIAGQHLLEPFVDWKFGIPISALTRNIEIMLLEQLGEEDIPQAIKPVNDEYLL